MAETSSDTEKVICSFEADEVSAWGAKFKAKTDTNYTTKRFTYYVDVGSGSTKTATHMISTARKRL